MSDTKDTKHEERYDDEVTPEVIEALNKIVSDDAFEDYKVISGPGW